MGTKKRSLMVLTVVATGLVAWFAGIGTAFGGKSGLHQSSVSAASMVDRGSLAAAAQISLADLPTPNQIVAIPNPNQRAVVNKIVELTERAVHAEEMANPEFEVLFNEISLMVAALEAGVSLVTDEIGVLAEAPACVSDCSTARGACIAALAPACVPNAFRCSCCMPCGMEYLECVGGCARPFSND